LHQGEKNFCLLCPNKNFTLTITFENDEKRIFDVKPYIKENTIFEQLADFDNFKRVYIDDSNNVCWDKNPEME